MPSSPSSIFFLHFSFKLWSSILTSLFFLSFHGIYIRGKCGWLWWWSRDSWHTRMTMNSLTLKTFFHQIHLEVLNLNSVKYDMILITMMLKGLLILKMAWIPALNLLDVTILETAWHGRKRGGGSLWLMIKDNIGKDLTRVHLPVYFNEPISSLQKCFEDLKYSCRILEETKEILQLYVAAVLYINQNVVAARSLCLTVEVWS